MMVGEESAFDRVLRPTRSALIAGEFLASSAHIPIAIGLATVLTHPPADWPLVVPALAAGFLQAWVIGVRAERRRPPSLLCNLIGPTLFTLGLLIAGWPAVAQDPLLGVYWIVSVLVGTCQAVGGRLSPAGGEAVLVGEHIVRSLGFVAVFAAISGEPLVFLDQPANRFLVAGTILLGALLGSAAVVARRNQTRLADVAGQLRGYSEMLLGRSALSRVLGREDDLRPRRTRRSVLFADICGFTRWSEERSPEEVLRLLSGVYAAAERASAPHAPSHIKLIGDEVMLFFAEPLAAARAALALREAVEAVLAPACLHIGVGLHHGEVVEGLVGGEQTKTYDILGDTVNTAKRICDQAAPGGILVSFTFYEACRKRLVVHGDQSIVAKGKSASMLVTELIGVEDAAPAAD